MAPLPYLLNFLLMRRWASLSSAGTSLSFSIIIELIYQIFKTVDLYQKEYSRTLCEGKDDNNLSDVSDVTDAVAIFLYCLFLCAELIPFDLFQTYLAPKMDCNSTNEFPT